MRALLEGLFDYAGMFPPAALPLEAALSEAAQLGRLRRPWLVGNTFVARARDLPNITADAVRRAGLQGPLKTCVVGVACAESAQWAPRIAAWAKGVPGAAVASVEATCEAAAEAGRLREAAAALPNTRLYAEPTWDAKAWASNVGALAGWPKGIGLKVRCSGTTALPPADLARVLARAIDARIPLKATQGLHHPLVEARYGNAHGFVGLAAAVRLRQIHGNGMGEAAMAACITEGSASAFGFDGVAWRGHHVPAAPLAAAVRALPFTIGSCSVAEPDDDLQRLWPA